MRTNPFLGELMDAFFDAGGRRDGGRGRCGHRLRRARRVGSRRAAGRRKHGGRRPRLRRQEPAGRSRHPLLRALPGRIRQEPEGQARGLLHAQARRVVHRALGARDPAQRVRARGRACRHDHVGRAGSPPPRLGDPGGHIARPGLRPDSGSRHRHRHLPRRGDRRHPQDDGGEVGRPGPRRARDRGALERLRAETLAAAPAPLRAADGTLRDRAPQDRPQAARDRLPLRERRARAGVPDQRAGAAARDGSDRDGLPAGAGEGGRGGGRGEADPAVHRGDRESAVPGRGPDGAARGSRRSCAARSFRPGAGP